MFINAIHLIANRSDLIRCAREGTRVLLLLLGENKRAKNFTRNLLYELKRGEDEDLFYVEFEKI